MTEGSITLSHAELDRVSVIRSIIRAHYIDFGPTFADEKLTELHACHCSVETLRKWMIKDGLWRGKQRKKAAIHQRRPRPPRITLGDTSDQCLDRACFTITT